MKFMVSIDADYLDGYLRHGHLEGVIEVESEEKLREMIDNEAILDYLDLVIDDYSVFDIGYGNNPFEYEVIE